MSSNQYNKTNMGQQCQTERIDKSPGAKNLLRLDSTGEITSDKRNTNKQVFFKCNGSQNKHSFTRTTNSDRNLLKLVGNLGVGSFFESAATYIGSLNPKNMATKNLSRASSGSCAYFKTVFSSSGRSEEPKTETIFTGSSIHNNCVNQMSAQQTDINSPANTTWSHLFQCLTSSCSANPVNMKTPKVERYIPPQKRLGMEERVKGSVFIDPKLTPYNAKLLEKSKKNNAHNSKQCNNANTVSVPCYPRLSKSSNNESTVKNVHKTLIQQSLNSDVGSDQKSECQTTGNLKEAELDIKTDLGVEIIEEPELLQDWFEYECPDGSITCIPVEIDTDKLNLSKKCEDKRQTSFSCQESNHDYQQLHTWCSVEFDDEVCIKDIDKSGTYCSSQNEKVKVECPGEKQLNVNKVLVSDSSKVKGKEQTSCLKKDKHATFNPQNVQCEKQAKNENEISAVLFVRNSVKKTRPSKKKRRRQKAQIEQGKHSNSLKPGSAIHPKNPVTFILGVDPHSPNSSSVNSFQFVCDTDSGSDWSDSEEDTDEDFSSLEEDKLLGLRCIEPLGSFGMFKISCSVQPSTQTTSSSAIDNINDAWQLHISIQTEPIQKKQSAKKVSFAENSRLAEVHPIIAWGYAYAAARKGPWEQYARDRARFQRRIEEADSLLTRCLQPQYRDDVFHKRFSNQSE